MPERFVALREMLQRFDDPEQFEPPECETQPIADDDEADGDLENALREVRLFRARVSEAFEESVEVLLRDVASEVLARELQCAPACIESIVDRTLQRWFDETPVRVRVHSSDLGALDACSVPAAGDDSLMPGDAIVDVRGGSIDARLGVRLETVLRTIAAR